MKATHWSSLSPAVLQSAIHLAVLGARSLPNDHGVFPLFSGTPGQAQGQHSGHRFPCQIAQELNWSRAM